MLDDLNLLASRDPHDTLAAAATQPAQATWMAQVKNMPPDKAPIETLVAAGMGGSALAADVAKSWLRLPIPFEVVRKYDSPRFVGQKTLVIVSSYSGNTEEALSVLEGAEAKRAQIAIIASGGQLIDIAQERNYPFVQLPEHYQPRMAALLSLRALVKIIESYGIVAGKYDEIAGVSDWLTEHSQAWLSEMPLANNLAKQLAMHAAGKTAVIYSGSRMAPVGYRWKTSFNENAKNMAFQGELPECSHNDLLGWTSHPVEKPYAVFDLISGFEHPQILRQFNASDRLLSGLRPKSVPVELQGESVIAQMLWGCLLADFVSIYLAVLNGVNPTQTDLIEKFKHELN